MVPSAALDVVPILAPRAALHVACGGAHAIAHGEDCGVPWGRAPHMAHVLALGAALGGVSPGMAPGAALIPGQATPAAPTRGPTAPPPCINIDALFAFLEQEDSIL